MDPRTPILVGIGTAHRPPDGSAGVEPVELMVEAARAAGDDTGVPSVVDRAGLVAVPRGNWSYPDPARMIADRLGCGDARTVLAEIGVPQASAINTALDRIRRGDLDIALVVGGEAMASRLRAERAGDDAPEQAGEVVAPDETWTPEGEFMADPEIQAGIWAPVEQYACIENALRHADGISVADHLDQVAELWAAFNVVARHNPAADFAEPRGADFLRAAGPGNRPLAFPYAKWHVTQWGVDQAAALLMCSVGVALDAGIARDRWVFPRVAIESSFSLSLTRRAEMHRWPAMRVLGAAAAQHIGMPLAEITNAELYSCFPAAVRVQQRELDLPADGVPTVMGGMTFAGGPFNNFTYQSTAAVVDRLRARPDELGLVTTVSGLLTKPGLAVWSAEPDDDAALIADLGDEARRRTAAVDVTGVHHGPATVASYTVTYEGEVRQQGVRHRRSRRRPSMDRHLSVARLPPAGHERRAVRHEGDDRRYGVRRLNGRGPSRRAPRSREQCGSVSAPGPGEVSPTYFSRAATMDASCSAEATDSPSISATLFPTRTQTELVGGVTLAAAGRR